MARKNPFRQDPQSRCGIPSGAPASAASAAASQPNQKPRTLSSPIQFPFSSILKKRPGTVPVITAILCLLVWIGAAAAIPWKPFEASQPQKVFSLLAGPQPSGEPAPSQPPSQAQVLPLCEIGLFSQEQRIQNVGDRLEITVPITPADVPQQEIQVLNSNPEVLQVGELAFTPQEDRCLLVFQVKAVSTGESQLRVSYGGGETSSNTLTITVQERGESSSVSSSSTTGTQDGIPNTVYVTPSGKRYHYSASCGGKNSQAATLEEAQRAGKTPCKKCVP